MSKCPKCHHLLPAKAKFCPNCGEPQRPESPKFDFSLNLDGDLAGQLMDYWFVALKKRLEEEDDIQRFSIFSERMYQSGFRDTLQRRLGHLAEQLRQNRLLFNIEREPQNGKIATILQELLDFFWIRHCRDLIKFSLPEKVLQYQGLSFSELNLYNLILDYLDFSNEQAKVYTNFFEMPKPHFQNASRYFLFAGPKERIFFICDLSLLGGCQDGFAMTEKNIFWKAPLEKPRQVAYAELQSLQLKSEWLLINEHFFNAGHTLNYKLFKLLQKLQQLYL